MKDSTQADAPCPLRSRLPVTSTDKTPSPDDGQGSRTATSSEATYWDAAGYHRVADPQFQWGKRLLERLELRGDETIIDAGCGSGRLTRLLLERVPRGHVIAVDVSRQMVEQARAYLEPDFGGRVEVLCRDLLALALDQVADIVFSTATFHWIPDQELLFANVARALKPRGRLLAQMGGEGNLTRLLSRADALREESEYLPYFENWVRPNVFPDEEKTRRRLRAAGFTKIHLEHFPEPTTFPDAEAFRDFVTTVNFRSYLQRLPTDELRRKFVDRIVQSCAADTPPFTLDYWRLNLSAIRR